MVAKSVVVTKQHQHPASDSVSVTEPKKKEDWCLNSLYFHFNTRYILFIYNIHNSDI